MGKLAMLVLASCIVACGDRPSVPRQRAPETAAAQTPQNPPAAPAPAVVPEPPADREGPIGVENSSGRSGTYYVPAASPLPALPLLVVLHGSGGSGAGMVSAFRSLAKAHGFAIVAPDSREHEGQFMWEVADQPGDVTPDLTHTMNCIDWVRAQVGFLVDDSHVLIAGYSAGGSSAPYIASNRPGFTHAAVLHGGVFPGGIGPRRLPVWFSTGDQDRYRPVELVRQYVDAVTNLGFSDVTFRTYPGRHELSGTELDDLINWWLSH